MPPKIKEITKRNLPPVTRPDISNASLNYVPNDAIEGYQERLETGIDWTIEEQAVRHHKRRFCDSLPEITFSQALKNKISKSVLGGFLDENSNISLSEQWELILPTTLWDNEKFANDECKICFRNANSITDDVIKLIKNSVRYNDRRMLLHDFKNVTVLRVNDTQMTKLDKDLNGFRKLVRVNLCGNFLNKINTKFIPREIKVLELKSNMIEDVETLAVNLPSTLLYLGLARNLLGDSRGLNMLPKSLIVLDIADNDICDLESVLQALSALPRLVSLQFAGNPCSVCLPYARMTILRLPQLQWLDLREIPSTDRSDNTLEIHPDDMRFNYFNFTVFRVISAPQPPKLDKGAVTSFHIELELPLLDSARRGFLMFRNNDSLVEMLPPPEEDIHPEPSKVASVIRSKTVIEGEASSQGSDMYRLTAVNSREIRHYTTFESNKVQWNKIMNFQEPTIRIFCPNLFALRDTFRTVVTIRLVYTVAFPLKQGKMDKKSAHSMKSNLSEQRATIATIKCALNKTDWSQTYQYFHWDDSHETTDATPCVEDLSTMQYSQAPAKIIKGKMDADQGLARHQLPENLTCHFGFGIDTLNI